MAMFDVTVPMVLSVRVEAETREQARDQAFAWADFLDPHDEVLEDFKTDHDSGVQPIGMGGVLEVNGAAEVEEAAGAAPGFKR
jgi:hypothetical protein